MAEGAAQILADLSMDEGTSPTLLTSATRLVLVLSTCTDCRSQLLHCACMRCGQAVLAHCYFLLHAHLHRNAVCWTCWHWSELS